MKTKKGSKGMQALRAERDPMAAGGKVVPTKVVPPMGAKAMKGRGKRKM